MQGGAMDVNFEKRKYYQILILLFLLLVDKNPVIHDCINRGYLKHGIIVTNLMNK